MRERIERGGSRRTYFARSRSLLLGERTYVMGVVNVTPDSFSDGGETFDTDAAVQRARRMVEEGAAIIDIGGESTRPGSEPLPLAQELRRVVPVIEALAGKVEALISIDTYKSAVARHALQAGAHIINDISGGSFDPLMPGVAAEYEAGVILMHIKGRPRDMQANPVYSDVVGEVKEFLRRAVARFEAAGVPKGSMLVDPGIGFGKTLEHNLELIANLTAFGDLAGGVLVGPSRKSFIGLLTGRPVKERQNGTLGAVVAGILCGADVVRVHDVRPTVEAVKVADAIKQRYRRNGSAG